MDRYEVRLAAEPPKGGSFEIQWVVEFEAKDAFDAAVKAQYKVKNENAEPPTFVEMIVRKLG